MSIRKRSLIVDIDGTICPVKKSGEKYEELVPYEEMVEKLKQWKDEGFEIILHTARQMRTHEGNIGLINVHTARMTMDWLDKWNVPYDEIHFAKPWPGHQGFYIDDRSIRPDEFMNNTLEEIEELIEQSRKRMEVSYE